jgi:4-hydroxy-tetrahydrodipicolinate synthase
MIPALKAIIAHWSKDSAWETVRPPLVELSAAQQTQVINELTDAGFTMPGLTEASA